ncbi:MAG: response regulator [Nitrospira sp.]|nr:response regulator [Nitrospira sp.]
MGNKVLIAESDSTVLQVISYFLKLEGFEITTVSDGAVVMDVVSRFMPEVILIDPGLAGVNGIKLSRDIRNKPEFKDVPILYVVEDMDALLKSGEEIPPGYGLIHKPIDPTRMVNTIKEVMEAVPDTLHEQVEPVGPVGPVGIEELLGWDVSSVLSSEDAQKTDTIMENDSAEVLSDTLDELTGTEEPEENIPVEVTESAIDEVERELEQTASVSPPSNEMIEEMISRISREFIEKVVMDVVPRIAEEEIKKEIERLKGESG